jgi:hypothetical protein
VLGRCYNCPARSIFHLPSSTAIRTRTAPNRSPSKLFLFSLFSHLHHQFTMALPRTMKAVQWTKMSRGIENSISVNSSAPLPKGASSLPPKEEEEDGDDSDEERWEQDWQDEEEEGAGEGPSNLSERPVSRLGTRSSSWIRKPSRKASEG